MCKQEHKHAIILRAIADGEQIQITSPSMMGQWIDATPSCVFANVSSFRKDLGYRIKPKTILINGMEISEPLRIIPKNGASVYCVSLAGDDTALVTHWWATPWQTTAFNRGLIHTTRGAALAHSEALLSFTQK